MVPDPLPLPAPLPLSAPAPAPALAVSVAAILGVLHTLTGASCSGVDTDDIGGAGVEQEEEASSVTCMLCGVVCCDVMEGVDRHPPRRSHSHRHRHTTQQGY